jgi:hypothetical protein
MLHRQEVDYHLKPGRAGPVPIHGGDIRQNFEPCLESRAAKLQQLLAGQPHDFLVV